MQQIVEGQRYQVGDAVYVGHGGQLVLETQPNSVTTRPGDPTLPTRQAILEQQLRHAEMQNRELSDRLGPQQTPIASNLTGEDFLATLPPADQRMVRALSEGRMQVPAGRALTQGNWQRWIQQAQQYDPALDVANARTRYATRREYTTGMASRNIQRLNTALGHLNSLAESADELENFGGITTLLNAPRNQVREWTGDPRITRFLFDRQAVADELEATFRGSGGTLEGTRGWRDRISSSQSPEQLRAAIQEAAELLNSRLHAVADSYNRGMGRADAHMDWLDPHAAETMSRYGFSEWGSGGEQPPAGPTGPNVSVEGTSATRNPALPGMDRTTQFNVQPGGGQSRELSTETNLQIDPALRTAGRHLGQMIASGRSDSEILEYMGSVGADPGNGNLRDVLRWRRGERVPGFNGTFQQWRSQNPNQAYPLGESFYTRDVPQSGTRRVISSIAESPGGSYTTMAGNALLGNRLDDIVGLTGGNAEQARAGIQALREQNPTASLAGDLSGAAMTYAGGNALINRLGTTAAARFVPSAIRNLGTAGRARLGDAAYGAYSGTGDDYGDAPLSIILNAGGGMFGRAAGRGAGRVLTGARDPALRILDRAGVPLTFGQMAGQGGRVGQVVRGLEERLSGLPVTGSFIKSQQRQGLEGFNRAAFNEGLAPISGANGARLGEDALVNARGLRSDAYDNTLSGVNLQVDPQLTADLAANRIAGRNVPMSNPSQFDFTMANSVDPFLASASGISGRDFQTAVRGLRRSRTAGMRELNGYEFGQALGDVEGSLTSAMNRQFPAVMPGLNAANAANRNISILGNAVERGQGAIEGGSPVFTPFQLNKASIANTVRYGGRDAATSPTRPFFELGRAAQEILPSRVPDSGTAGRWLLPATLIGGGQAADASGFTDNAGKAGLGLSALSLPYTNAGRAALQRLLMSRPELSREAGEFLLSSPNFARRIGMFAAPVPGYYGQEDNY